MSKFKVGDKVVRNVQVNSGGLVKGELYTVSIVEGPWIQVEGNSTSAGRRCPFNESYFDLAPYHRYFTEQPAKAEPTTGHAAGSPIQKHSKGEFYPLCVVGYSDADRMAYTIENLEKGTVLGFMSNEFNGGSNIRAWSSANYAYEFLANQRDKADASLWIEGRPTFIKNGNSLEVVVPPKHKRMVVTLEKVDMEKDTMLLNGVYYQALEQDIG